MENSPLEFTENSTGDPVAVVKSPLDYRNVGPVWEGIDGFLKINHPRKLFLDLRLVSTVDGAGAGFFKALARRCRSLGTDLQFVSAPESIQPFLQYAEEKNIPESEVPGRSAKDLITRLGRAFGECLEDAHELIQFVGVFVVATLKNLIDIRRFRWRETTYYLQLSGADALPILWLLSFLMGLVIGFQAAVQLRQFGANIFVADLVSLSITRELGPLLTAIILAGRSGSAFAAELGTMKVNEEVDALTVMGFNIMDFLVLPKIAALAIAGPLLTLLADAAGILGGVVVGIVGLDLTFAAFMEEAYLALTLKDVVSGLIKGLVFAILVSLVGCFRGLQTERGADSVGRQTTSAVVSGIFLIIVADSIFTVVFHVFDF